MNFYTCKSTIPDDSDNSDNLRDEEDLEEASDADWAISEWVLIIYILSALK